MESEINNIIDKSHFKTFDHVENSVRKQYPDVKNKTIKKVISNRLHDKFIKQRKIEPYYVKIFSSQTNTWFHDLLDNGKDVDPRYWHIFIGTNNHYAVALPLNSRNQESIHSTLSQFISQYHPSKLTSSFAKQHFDKQKRNLLNQCL